MHSKKGQMDIKVNIVGAMQAIMENNISRAFSRPNEFITLSLCLMSLALLRIVCARSDLQLAAPLCCLNSHTQRENVIILSAPCN